MRTFKLISLEAMNSTDVIQAIDMSIINDVT